MKSDKENLKIEVLSLLSKELTESNVKDVCECLYIYFVENKLPNLVDNIDNYLSS